MTSWPREEICSVVVSSCQGRWVRLASETLAAKRRKEWPPWWEWELEVTDYTYKRLRERDCTEVELRRMMNRLRRMGVK